MIRIWIIFILIHDTVGTKRSAEDFLESFCIETIKRVVGVGIVAPLSVATGCRVCILSHIWL